MGDFCTTKGNVSQLFYASEKNKAVFMRTHPWILHVMPTSLLITCIYGEANFSGENELLWKSNFTVRLEPKLSVHASKLYLRKYNFVPSLTNIGDAAKFTLQRNRT